MRHLLILAASASLAATAAHAQIDPVTGRPYGATAPGMPSARQPDVSRPMQPMQPMQPMGPPGPGRLPNPNAREPSVAVAHPFSPAGEAARERKENAIPQGGMFSPEGEAKRAAAQAKRDKANASPF